MEDKNNKSSFFKKIENHLGDTVEKVKNINIKDKIITLKNKYIYILSGIISVIALLIVVISLLSSNLDNSNINSNNNNGNSEEYVKKYSIKIHIDFIENWIFSRYDVVLSLGYKSKTLLHGVNEDVEFDLEEGSYTLYFVSADDSSIKYEEKVEIKSNIDLGYKIECHYDRIVVENLYIDREEELEENEIKISFDESKFSKKNYKDIVSELRELGFTNIVEEPVYDIVNKSYSNGEISSVTIDGKKDYKRGEVFNNDVKIVVKYHLDEQEDPSRISPPYDTDSAKGINYNTVIKAFKDAGFTNVHTNQITNHNNKNIDKNVYSINIDGISIDKNKKYKHDDKIVITYHNYEPKREEVSLSHSGAKKAFENYGKSIYRYGFKCHWFLKLIDAEDRADGSIYYKVGVTITNQYNASYDAIAEGVVSGTDANPKISNFRVK